MIWNFKTSKIFDKQFGTLPKTEQKRLLRFFTERLLSAPDPKSLGKALTGDLSGIHSYRVGDYRFLAIIDESISLIYGVDIGHRRDIYEKTKRRKSCL